MVKDCKFETRGQAKRLSDHMKDLSEHTPEKLLEAGYEAWYIMENKTDESDRIVDWLLKKKFIIENPGYGK